MNLKNLLVSVAAACLMTTSCSVWQMAALRQQAERGDAKAQFVLGDELYFEGRYAKAGCWYRKAAEQGHVQSQVMLGNMCYDGKLPDDPEEAVKWYRLAAEKDDVAQFMMGECSRYGRGVPQNDLEAVRWFLLGGEGTAVQQRRLEACYAFYKSAPVDYARAYAIETAEADTQEVYGRYDVWRDLTPEQLAEGLRRLTEYEQILEKANNTGGVKCGN